MTWDLRSNMKATPGSQGVLFRGGKDQMTDARYPKGYTPERLQVARSAIDPNNFYSRGEHGKVGTTGPQRRDLIDTVARSTVPAEHLQGLQFHPGQLSLAHGSIEDPAGYYRHQGHRLGESVAHKPQIAIRKGYETADTPVHEIGHHVSRTRGTEHSAYDTPERKGREEAFADDYAAVHYQPPRGEPKHPVGLYGDGLPTGGRTKQFYDAYTAHRTTPIGYDIHGLAGKEKQHEQANPTLPGLARYGRLGLVR